MTPQQKWDGFQKTALVTTASTYLLIMVGALVRVSGAGMGCPDWPKCFGLWIPPTDASQLPSQYNPAEFNVVHTWTEYLNRLLGVSIGLLIFATLVMAIRQHRHNKHVLFSSLLAFFGVGYAGWLGSKVVKTVLEPWMVTVHLVSALVVVSALLYSIVFAFLPSKPVQFAQGTQRRFGMMTIVLFVITLLQTALGTQVRGLIEKAIRMFGEMPREEWLSHVGWIDIAHRQVAVVIFAVAVFMAYRARKTHMQPVLWATSMASMTLAGAQIVAGLLLAYAAMPAAVQIIHLGLGSLLLGSLTVQGLFAFCKPDPQQQ